MAKEKEDTQSKTSCPASGYMTSQIRERIVRGRIPWLKMANEQFLRNSVSTLVMKTVSRLASLIVH